MEKMYTRKEAATLLGISITTLDQARSAGQITYVQYVDNGCVYFTEAAIQEYVARCTRNLVCFISKQMRVRLLYDSSIIQISPQQDNP